VGKTAISLCDEQSLNDSDHAKLNRAHHVHDVVLRRHLLQLFLAALEARLLALADCSEPATPEPVTEKSERATLEMRQN
jgi:hypothetical protein